MTSDAQIARRQVYEAEVRRAGGPSGAYGYGLLVLWLALFIAGKYRSGLSNLIWVELGVMVSAQVCFLIVVLKRRRWRRDHPFQG